MIDLHMHSLYSDDGSFSPLALVESCAAKGIKTMSITDHNCVRANKEALPEAKKRGIHYISGVEIDCTYQDVNFHLLGYGFDDQSADFTLIEDNIKKQVAQASRDMLFKTQNLGFLITEADLYALSKDRYWSEAWTGEMFAEVLLAKPQYTTHPLLSPYRPGGPRADNPFVNFYWDFYSQGKPCHSTITYPPMAQILDLIHSNHGLGVLAHPGVNLKGRDHLLEGIINLGIDGIEAFSSYHTSDQSTHYHTAVQQHHLMVTCGSDFHGKTKPAINLGAHNAFISEEEIAQQICQILETK